MPHLFFFNFYDFFHYFHLFCFHFYDFFHCSHFIYFFRFFHFFHFFQNFDNFASLLFALLDRSGAFSPLSTFHMDVVPSSLLILIVISFIHSIAIFKCYNSLIMLLFVLLLLLL